MSVEEDNKALVRRFTEEVAKQGNLDVADELLAPDFVDHDLLPGKVADIEDFKRWVADELRASFSDYHFSIEEQVAEGDKVVTRLSIAVPTIKTNTGGSSPAVPA